MVVMSGLCSVYFEKVLKNGEVKITIWERNVQLAFYSLIVVSGICINSYIDFGEVTMASLLWGKDPPFVTPFKDGVMSLF